MRDGKTHECFLRIENDLHQCRISLTIVKGFHVEADQKARNPLMDEWSVDEDKLLLAFQEQHEQDWTKGYKLARKENPKMYNKVMVNETILKERVRQLKSDQMAAYRFKLLQKDLEQQLSEHNAGILGQARANAANQKEVYKPLPKMHKNVIVRLVPRTGSPTTVEANAQALIQHSPHLKTLLHHAQANKYEVKTIQLSERDRNYADYPNLYDVFGVDNVSRYIEFTENPQLWANKEIAHEQLKNVKNNQSKSWKEFHEGLESSRQRYLNRLKELQQREEEVLVTELTKCMEEDKRQLIYLHTAHLQNELSKMRQRYEALVNDVQEFYNNEISKLTELNLRYDESERGAVEQQVAEAEYHIKNIFTDKGILRLLILSDVLQDADLRTACLQRIASKITKFYKSPELGCELLRSMSLQELLSMCSNQQLVAMQTGKEYHFKEDLLRKEIAYREAHMSETYRTKSLKELTDLQVAEKELWPHLLEEEINRRRDNATANVSLDIKKLNNTFVLIDKERRTATLTKPLKYGTVVATMPKSSSGWGKWYWECKIINFERLNGCTISLGWDVPRQNYNDSYVPGLQSGLNNTDFGCTWTSDGLLHYNGVAEEIFTTFDKDDVVGCGMDQDRKLYTFYKNGQQISLVKKRPEIKMPDNYVLYPCICMYAARPRQFIKVTAEFCGPFEFKLPKFFRPYGHSNPYKTVTDDSKADHNDENDK